MYTGIDNQPIRKGDTVEVAYPGADANHYYGARGVVTGFDPYGVHVLLFSMHYPIRFYPHEIKKVKE